MLWVSAPYHRIPHVPLTWLCGIPLVPHILIPLISHIRIFLIPHVWVPLIPYNRVSLIPHIQVLLIAHIWITLSPPLCIIELLLPTPLLHPVPMIPARVPKSMVILPAPLFVVEVSVFPLLIISHNHHGLPLDIWYRLARPQCQVRSLYSPCCDIIFYPSQLLHLLFFLFLQLLPDIVHTSCSAVTQ